MVIKAADNPEEFRYLILALQRQGNRQLNSYCEKLGLTSSQAEAIEIIGRYGPINTRDVGSYLICESGSPSRLLSTLSTKGLTMSARSTTDKRETLHALTPQGRSILQQIEGMKEDFHHDLSMALSRAASAYPGDVLAQLASLLTDSDLVTAMKRRFPDLFSQQP